MMDLSMKVNCTSFVWTVILYLIEKSHDYVSVLKEINDFWLMIEEIYAFIDFTSFYQQLNASYMIRLESNKIIPEIINNKNHKS